MKRPLFCAVIISLLLSLVIIGISCTKAKPTISYSPASLSFTATQGGDNPVIQAVGVWNSGGGTLNWSVSNDATWLNLSPTNASSTGGTSNVIVSVDIAGLTAGNHNALITISASSATNMPQTIPVTLTVASPPTPTSTPTLTPTPSLSDDYNTDLQVAQIATAVFYSDVHSGWKDVKGDDNPNNASSFNDNVWGRVESDTVPGHYYPTAIAQLSNHILTFSPTTSDSRNSQNPLVLGSGGHAATESEIQAHAIWMGLLVKAAGSGTQYSGSLDRGWVSPLQGDTSLYVNNILQSSMAGNSYNGGPEPGGSYCWVVGKNGYVFGVYKSSDGYWYSGFNGTYP